MQYNQLPHQTGGGGGGGGEIRMACREETLNA